MSTDAKTVAKIMRTIRGLPDSTPPAKPIADEADALTRDIVHSFAENVRRFTKTEVEGWLLWEKKDAKWEDLLRHSKDKHLNKTSYSDLERIARDNPEQALERWEELKAAAREDLASGWQAGRSLRQEVFHDAWDQACYLAVREQFELLWPSRNGVESMMVDEMVQYEMYRRMVLKALWNITPESRYESPGKLLQALDRIQRLFQESLRTLLTLRRSRAPVVVANVTALKDAGDQESDEATET